jgi:hypothetical protein
MGMVMIVSIATEMAIFYVSEFQEPLTHMQAPEALMRASANRLRPITMTTRCRSRHPDAADPRPRPEGRDAAAAGRSHHRRAIGTVPADAAGLAAAASLWAVKAKTSCDR